MAGPNSKLRQARQERSLSMEELAKSLGTTKEVIYRWENGITSPNPSSRRRLCEFFGMSLQELGLLSQEPASDPRGALSPSLSEEHQDVPREPVRTSEKNALRQKEIILVLLVAVVIMGGLISFFLFRPVQLGTGWVDDDLTVLAGGGAGPMPGSPLDGYWGSDSSQHVNFIGTDGHIHELYIHPGVGWVNNDLIVLAGGGLGPVPGSSLNGYWDGDSSQHINFIGTDGHVHELYIHPGAWWVNNDLIVLARGGVGPMPGSPLNGYWGSDGSQHVNFIGTDGHIHELYIHPGAGWVNNDLTVLAGGGVGPMPGSPLNGYWGSDSSQHVNFIGTDGHIHELYIHPRVGWVNNDLIVLARGGVGPMPGSPLNGYWGSDSSQHVNFIGTDGHIHELYIHPGAGWINNDLAVLAGGGVGPMPGSPLNGYWGSDSSQHVNFIDTDGHIHELYIHPWATGWINNDLTVLAGGGVGPMPGSPLNGYWGSDSSRHVNFIGTDGHIHELYIRSGAGWVSSDLAVLAGAGLA